MKPDPTAQRRDDVIGQADKFRDMARELQCDEDPATFEDNLRRIVRSQEKPDGPREEDGDAPQGG